MIASLPQQHLWKNLAFKNNNQRRLLDDSQKRLPEQIEHSRLMIASRKSASDHQSSVENLARGASQSSYLLPKLNSMANLHVDEKLFPVKIPQVATAKTLKKIQQ